MPGYPYEGCYQFRCLVNRGMMGVNSLPKTVTRQRRGCDLNPGPSAPVSSTATEPPTIVNNALYVVIPSCCLVVGERWSAVGAYQRECCVISS